MLVKFKASLMFPSIIFMHFLLLETILLKNTIKKNLIIASPDAGGMERARAFAKRSNIVDLAMTEITKEDQAPNVAEITNVIGNVKKVCSSY